MVLINKKCFHYLLEHFWSCFLSNPYLKSTTILGAMFVLGKMKRRTQCAVYNLSMSQASQVHFAYTKTVSMWMVNVNSFDYNYICTKKNSEFKLRSFAKGVKHTMYTNVFMFTVDETIHGLQLSLHVCTYRICVLMHFSLGLLHA